MELLPALAYLAAAAITVAVHRLARRYRPSPVTQRDQRQLARSLGQLRREADELCAQLAVLTATLTAMNDQSMQLADEIAVLDQTDPRRIILAEELTDNDDMFELTAAEACRLQLALDGKLSQLRELTATGGPAAAGSADGSGR